MRISIRRTVAGVWACVGALVGSSAHAQSSAEVYFSSELRPKEDIWYTAPPPESAITYRLSRQPNVSFTAPQAGVNPIDVNPNLTFQEMIGFGTSLEDTTLYAILKNKTDAQRRTLLRELFDPVNGIGLNIIRVTIGTADFSDGRTVSTHPRGFYSYQDGGENTPFSIANDRNIYNTTLGYTGGIIAAVKLALEVARQAGNEPIVFASAWSPPAWMKTSNALIGGSLRPGFESRLAQYFRNFIQAYAAEGIPIYAITIQNERNFLPANYPGMLLSDQQEADVVRLTYENFNNIGGNFGAIVDTRLWILDHNFSNVQSAINVVSILKAQGKGHYVDAAAFHHYGGSPADMSRFTSAHPETDLVFTEGSVWGTGPNPTTSFESVLRMLRTGARTYVGWVTMSTRNKAEHNQGPFTNTNLSPALFIETSGAAYVKTPEYWLFGQFSKFIKPGAVRIDSEYGSTANVTTVAFRNPDGQTVLVAVNGTTSAQSFSIGYRGLQAASTLPAKTIGTYLWSDAANTAPAVTIAAPTNGQSFAQGTTVQVSGTAGDSGGLNRVEYRVDGGAAAAVATNGQTSVALSRALTNLGVGAHTIAVTAVDNATPALSTTQSVSFNVTAAANTAPTVNVTAPANGQQFPLNSAVQVTGTAADNSGVASIEYVVDAGAPTVVAANGQTSASFSRSLTGLAAGSHTVRVVAIDNGNPALRSTAVTISFTVVASGGNTIPTVNVTAPTNGQSFAAGAAVQVTGTATDNSGVASIEYVVDAGAPTVVAANGQTSVPFSRSLTGLAAGSHTVRVVAIDNGNPALRSTAITIGFTLAGGGGGFTGDGTYRIVNVNSGSALDVAGVSLADGANIQQWTYGGGNNQRWRVTTVTAGVYRIDAVHSGKTLDVRGVSTANGAQIQQWAFTGGSNQLWRIVSLGSNQFRIESVLSSKALTVSGASTANGALIQQSDYTGANNQRWTFAAP